MHVDNTYYRMITDTLHNGVRIPGRNGDTHMQTCLFAEFKTTPLVSLRKTGWMPAIKEFEWFLSGSERIADLAPSVHHWWSAWVGEDGVVKNNYSKQFRRYGKDGTFDQIAHMIEQIRSNPYSRRIIATTWNSEEMASPETPLTNCHGTVIQVTAYPDRTLELTMVQRSADLVVGVPHNWIQYWAFLMWLCRETNYQARCLKWIGINCHVYAQHFDLVRRLDNLWCNTIKYPDTPELVLTHRSSDAFSADEFVLVGEPYKPLSTERAELVV